MFPGCIFFHFLPCLGDKGEEDLVHSVTIKIRDLNFVYVHVRPHMKARGLEGIHLGCHECDLYFNWRQVEFRCTGHIKTAGTGNQSIALLDSVKDNRSSVLMKQFNWNLTEHVNDYLWNVFVLRKSSQFWGSQNRLEPISPWTGKLLHMVLL